MIVVVFISSGLNIHPLTRRQKTGRSTDNSSGVGYRFTSSPLSHSTTEGQSQNSSSHPSLSLSSEQLMNIVVGRVYLSSSLQI